MVSVEQCFIVAKLTQSKVALEFLVIRNNLNVDIGMPHYYNQAVFFSKFFQFV